MELSQPLGANRTGGAASQLPKVPVVPTSVACVLSIINWTPRKFYRGKKCKPLGLWPKKTQTMCHGSAARREPEDLEEPAALVRGPGLSIASRHQSSTNWRALLGLLCVGSCCSCLCWRDGLVRRRCLRDWAGLPVAVYTWCGAPGTQSWLQGSVGCSGVVTWGLERGTALAILSASTMRAGQGEAGT